MYINAVEEVAEIRELEEQLLRHEVRLSETRLLELLAPDFREFGASGQVWNRDQVIERLKDAQPVRRNLSSFTARSLASNVVLATYEVHRVVEEGSPPATSLRSSIWVLEEGGWRLAFHQGTLRRPENLHDD